eukprot:jgi/Bigna1/72337/fgenesh1_pg.19_\
MARSCGGTSARMLVLFLATLAIHSGVVHGIGNSSLHNWDFYGMGEEQHKSKDREAIKIISHAEHSVELLAYPTDSRTFVGSPPSYLQIVIDFAPGYNQIDLIVVQADWRDQARQLASFDRLPTIFLKGWGNTNSGWLNLKLVDGNSVISSIRLATAPAFRCCVLELKGSKEVLTILVYPTSEKDSGHSLYFASLQISVRLAPTPYPTSHPTSMSPTNHPTSQSPVTAVPTHVPSSGSPATSCPSVSPSTMGPTTSMPSTSSPSSSMPSTTSPSSMMPTNSPITNAPSLTPTLSPTLFGVEAMHAILGDTATFISIRFNWPVDAPGAKALDDDQKQADTCLNLLHPHTVSQLGTAPRCFWKTDNLHLILRFGPGFLITPGVSVVSLIERRIQRRDVPTELNKRFDLLVEFPHNPPTLKLSVIGPSSVGTCNLTRIAADPVRLFAYTEGGVGRDLIYVWKVRRIFTENGGNSIALPIPVNANWGGNGSIPSNATAMEQLLAIVESTRTPELIFPSSLLFPGYSHLFEVSATSWLRAAATANHTVARKTTSFIPRILFPGQRDVTILSTQALSFPTQVHVPCHEDDGYQDVLVRASWSLVSGPTNVVIRGPNSSYLQLERNAMVPTIVGSDKGKGGEMYTFLLRAESQHVQTGATLGFAQETINVHVRAAPVTAILKGGTKRFVSVIRSSNFNITADASLSTNPSYPNETLQYEFSFFVASSSSSDSHVPFPSGEAKILPPSSTDTPWLAAVPASLIPALGTYVIRVNVSSNIRFVGGGTEGNTTSEAAVVLWSVTHQTLEVVAVYDHEDDQQNGTVLVPNVELKMLNVGNGEESLDKFDSNSPLRLRADVDTISLGPPATTQKRVLSYSWTCDSLNLNNLSDPLHLRSRLELKSTGRYFSLAPNTVRAGETYTFTVKVKVLLGENSHASVATSAFGAASITIRANSPPALGFCGARPNVGIAMSTSFRLECRLWNDEDQPLRYQFQIKSAPSLSSSSLSSTTFLDVCQPRHLEYYQIEMMPFIGQRVGRNYSRVDLRATIFDGLGASTRQDFAINVSKPEAVSLVQAQTALLNLATVGDTQDFAIFVYALSNYLSTSVSSGALDPISSQKLRLQMLSLGRDLSASNPILMSSVASEATKFSHPSELSDANYASELVADILEHALDSATTTPTSSGAKIIDQEEQLAISVTSSVLSIAAANAYVAKDATSANLFNGTGSLTPRPRGKSNESVTNVTATRLTRCLSKATIRLAGQISPGGSPAKIIQWGGGVGEESGKGDGISNNTLFAGMMVMVAESTKDLQNVTLSLLDSPSSSAPRVRLQIPNLDNASGETRRGRGEGVTASFVFLSGSSLYPYNTNDTVGEGDGSFSGLSIVELKDKNTGATLHIRNNSQPFRLSVPMLASKRRHADTRQFREECMYWSESEARWSTRGVSVLKSDPTARNNAHSSLPFITCESHHLTAFSGRFQLQINAIDEDDIRDKRSLDPRENAIMALIIALWGLYVASFVVATYFGDGHNDKENSDRINEIGPLKHGKEKPSKEGGVDEKARGQLERQVPANAHVDDETGKPQEELGSIYSLRSVTKSRVRTREEKQFWRSSNGIRKMHSEGKRSVGNFLKASRWMMRRRHPWISVIWRHSGDYMNSQKRLTMLLALVLNAAVVCSLIRGTQQQLGFISGPTATAFVACVLAFPVPFSLFWTFARRAPREFQVHFKQSGLISLIPCLFILAEDVEFQLADTSGSDRNSQATHQNQQQQQPTENAIGPDNNTPVANADDQHRDDDSNRLVRANDNKNCSDISLRDMNDSNSSFGGVPSSRYHPPSRGELELISVPQISKPSLVSTTPLPTSIKLQAAVTTGAIGAERAGTSSSSRRSQENRSGKFGPWITGKEGFINNGTRTITVAETTTSAGSATSILQSLPWRHHEDPLANEWRCFDYFAMSATLCMSLGCSFLLAIYSHNAGETNKDAVVTTLLSLPQDIGMRILSITFLEVVLLCPCLCCFGAVVYPEGKKRRMTDFKMMRISAENPPFELDSKGYIIKYSLENTPTTKQEEVSLGWRISEVDGEQVSSREQFLHVLCKASAVREFVDAKFKVNFNEPEDSLFGIAPEVDFDYAAHQRNVLSKNFLGDVLHESDIFSESSSADWNPGVGVNSDSNSDDMDPGFDGNAAAAMVLPAQSAKLEEKGSKTQTVAWK